MEGYGIYIWPDGSSFEGFFKYGKDHEGIYHRKDGRAEKGMWSQFKRQSKIKLPSTKTEKTHSNQLSSTTDESAKEVNV